MSFERKMLAAQGYLELNMPTEALQEIESLTEEDLTREEVMQLHLLLLMQLRLWTEGVALCEAIRERFPERSVGFIHGAFCLHELGRTSEAKEILLAGPAELQTEATYYYNLGCYDAVLGNMEEAQNHLRRSFEMDGRFREVAKFDPDLQPLAGIL